MYRRCGLDLIGVREYEAAARERLPTQAFDYYAGGAHDEVTLRENRDAFDRLRLRYRVLRDVSRRDLRTTVCGAPVSMPILVAPTAFHRLAHPEGEVATARGAGAAGAAMMLSTLSTSSIEDVAEAATGPLWFQLYVYRDRGATRALVERAEAAGCGALVLTVDAPLWGVRERDVRNRFRLPEGLTIRNLPGGMDVFPRAEGSGLAAYVTAQFDLALSWRDVEWLCGLTSLPVLVKGIVSPEDARLAIASGAAGVVVSNHGGRQLDTAPAAVEALPEIVEAVDGRIEVLVDGGVRRGTDVVKALALGARAVGVGRPVLWGLAVGGADGVARVLGILRDELDLALGLCGCRSLAEVGPELLFRRGAAGA